jgi:hypothetical protein
LPPDLIYEAKPTNVHVRCGAEVIFKLLKSHDPGAHTQRLCRHSEAKHNDEAEEPDPEHKERTKMVLKFTLGLGLIEDGMKEFEDIDWNEQRAATTRRGIMSILVPACCWEILKEKRSLSCHMSVLYFFKLSSVTHEPPPVLEMIQMTCLEFFKKCLSLNCHLFVMFNIIVHFLLV